MWLSVDFFFPSRSISLSYSLLSGSVQGLNEECVMKEGSLLVGPLQMLEERKVCSGVSEDCREKKGGILLNTTRTKCD